MCNHYEIYDTSAAVRCCCCCCLHAHQHQQQHVVVVASSRVSRSRKMHISIGVSDAMCVVCVCDTLGPLRRSAWGLGWWGEKRSRIPATRRLDGVLFASSRTHTRAHTHYIKLVCELGGEGLCSHVVSVCEPRREE